MPAKIQNAANIMSSSLIDSMNKTMSPQHLETSSIPDLVSLGSQCNACMFCSDTCGNSNCNKCTLKTIRIREMRQRSCRSSSSPFGKRKGTDDLCITPCELKRHNNIHSAWIRCGNVIYDATDHVANHPGGSSSILRKAGGVKDCTRDMNFHSAQAVQMMKKSKIGVLVPCPGETGKDCLFADLSNDESCVIC
jgi:cytochrome b involved in lipid metabolism